MNFIVLTISSHVAMLWTTIMFMFHIQHTTYVVINVIMLQMFYMMCNMGKIYQIQ